MNRKLLVIFIGTAAALVVSAPKAHANAQLELESGSAVSIVNVSDAVADSTGVSFTGTVGGWSVSVSIAITDGPAPAQPYVDLSSTATTTGASSPLYIIFSAQDFSLSPGTATTTLSGTSERGTLSSAGAAISGKSYYDPLNKIDMGAGGGSGTQLSLLTSNPGSTGLLPTLSGTHAIPLIAEDYSLTAILDIPDEGPGEAQVVAVQDSISVAPVPDGGMTLMMLGSALVGLTGIRSRLARKSV